MKGYLCIFFNSCCLTFVILSCGRSFTSVFFVWFFSEWIKQAEVDKYLFMFTITVRFLDMSPSMAKFRSKELLNLKLFFIFLYYVMF